MLCNNAWIVGLLAWGAAAYGVLQLERLPGDFGHDLCGPWGCLPPLQALAAMHGFWAVVLLPPVVWALRRCPPPALRRLGAVLALLGVLGIVLVTVREALTWYPSVPPAYRRYLPRRIAYAVVTLTDFPVVQLTAAGLVCRLAARRRERIVTRREEARAAPDGPAGGQVVNV
jgi:hypothetical protein